jgi:hypothetical protein
VWAIVVDLESHPRWRPALREFRQVSEGPLGVGSRIREVLAWRGRELVLADEVTALDPERRFGIRGGWRAATFELDILLEPRGQATVVIFDWTLQPRSLLMRVAAPFLKGTFDRSTAEELEGLSRYVEAHTGVPSGSQP